MARRKKTPPKELLYVSAIKITAADASTLDRIAQDASDSIGWSVSRSAVVRALIRSTDRQDGPWVIEQLFPLVEQEIQGGTVWGTKQRSRPARSRRASR
jgi:hypothetical protein